MSPLQSVRGRALLIFAALVSVAAAVILLLAVTWRTEDTNKIAALSTINCQQVELVKATLVSFIAEVTNYNPTTGQVETPKGEAPPTERELQRTISFNLLAESRFAPQPCH